LRRVDSIIIHCSATQNGNSRWSIADIDEWHAKRGFGRRPEAVVIGGGGLWEHVGYHRVINVDGVVETGRDISEVGAHCSGYNETSVGICMMGTDAFTEPQWESLRRQVLALSYEAGHFLSVNGHNKYSSKSCPGFDVISWLRGGMTPLRGHVVE